MHCQFKVGVNAREKQWDVHCPLTVRANRHRGFRGKHVCTEARRVKQSGTFPYVVAVPTCAYEVRGAAIKFTRGRKKSQDDTAAFYDCTDHN